LFLYSSLGLYSTSDLSGDLLCSCPLNLDIGLGLVTPSLSWNVLFSGTGSLNSFPDFPTSTSNLAPALPALLPALPSGPRESNVWAAPSDLLLMCRREKKVMGCRICDLLIEDYASVLPVVSAPPTLCHLALMKPGTMSERPTRQRTEGGLWSTGSMELSLLAQQPMRNWILLTPWVAITPEWSWKQILFQFNLQMTVAPADTLAEVLWETQG
jgi:hypothetical protein